MRGRSCRTAFYDELGRVSSRCALSCQGCRVELARAVPGSAHEQGLARDDEILDASRQTPLWRGKFDTKDTVRPPDAESRRPRAPATYAGRCLVAAVGTPRPRTTGGRQPPSLRSTRSKGRGRCATPPALAPSTAGGEALRTRMAGVDAPHPPARSVQRGVWQLPRASRAERQPRLAPDVQGVRRSTDRASSTTDESNSRSPWSKIEK
jgi:hypothetical protein